jgi:major membrane immunogen (membrane-anchored lipoprotein)
MAALDIQGFITPEQQFTGLTKLGDTLAAQQAAKQKEQAAKDANKKLLNKTVEDIDPKDFMTLTIEDGVITNKIYNLKKEASDYISQNPNVDQNQLNGWLANKTRGIATASQNIKEIKRKADNAWQEIQTNPSADKNKYYTEWNKMFMNPDGSVREDIEAIDPTQDYTTQILTNGDIWNDSAIYAAIDKSQANPLSYKNKTLYRDPTGKSVLSDVEYAHSEFYAPEMDASGHFTNKFRPANYKKATDANNNVMQVPKLDAMGRPMVDKQGNTITEDQNIISDDAWKFFKEANPQTIPVINRKLINYGKQHNVDPGGIEAENAVRHELFNQFDIYPKKAKASIVSGTQYKIPTAPRSGGGKGDGKDVQRKMFEEITNAYTEGEGLAGGIAGGVSEKGGKMFSYNASNLETDTGNHLVEVINKRFPSKKRNIDQLEIYRNTAGTIEVRDVKSGKLLLPLSEAFDIGGQVSKGGKVKAVEETEKEKMKTGISPKIVGKAKSGTSQTKGFKGTNKKLY